MSIKIRFIAKKISADDAAKKTPEGGDVKKTPAHEYDRIIIRLPTGLHQQLKTAALDTRQSMTAVVVRFLEAGLAKYTPGLEPQEASRRLNAEAIATLNEIIVKAKDVVSVLSAQQLTTKGDE